MNTLIIPESGNDAPLPRLLRALGATFTTCSIERLREHKSDSGSALILSEEQLVLLDRMAQDEAVELRRTLPGFRHVLVWPIYATAPGLDALARLTGMRFVPTGRAGGNVAYCVGGSRAICGPFSGLSLPAHDGASARPLEWMDTMDAGEWLATIGGDGLVGRFSTPQLEVFVNSTEAVFSADVEHQANLQASDCFAGLVPLIWFIRHCRIPHFRVEESWANWIIDDPNLTPRYGFIQIDELIDSVIGAKAAMTIGFIPWNYRRTNPSIVKKLRGAWPQASICVHGCNHTRAEFATPTFGRGYQLGETALRRMRLMESHTTLRFDRVMVFPQGKFSRHAMTALRHLDLIGTVNTELRDCATGLGVTGAELLQPALDCHSGLPMFLRRPANDPIANFALDLLLGKPCLIVTHHDYFRDGVSPMVDRIHELNQLDPALRWRSLEEGIGSTAAFRRGVDGGLQVRMYAPKASLALPGPLHQVEFAKREPELEYALKARVNGRPVSVRRVDSDVIFSGEGGDRVANVEIGFSSRPEVPAIRVRFGDRMKIAARRYLSEFRDNHVDRLATLKAGVAALRRIAPVSR